MSSIANKNLKNIVSEWKIIDKKKTKCWHLSTYKSANFLTMNILWFMTPCICSTKDNKKRVPIIQVDYIKLLKEDKTLDELEIKYLVIRKYLLSDESNTKCTIYHTLSNTIAKLFNQFTLHRLCFAL